ncbi:hypothetical protein C1C97_001815 [Kocuria tytonis]|uniref:Uncharacterized protein n=2 Tax=Kocuria tytonis TaxID=2054280 RepID=A0A495A8R6_9MICC|nr:hypothetical protein C1C97_001815 [Kocuria tytonis]
MNNDRNTPAPKGRMSRRTALIVAGALVLVIVLFFIIRSAITLSTIPTPDETPREGTVSPSSSSSP